MTCYSASIFAAVVLLAPPGYAGQAAAPPKPPPSAQKPQPAAPSPSVPAPPQPAASPADPVLDAAQNLIGKALFLRGFYTADNLSYDAAGKIEGATKAGDWTLAAINILKATHPAPDALELDGVRAAIRYNPDAHEFQRHPLNDEKMKLLGRVHTTVKLC